jgi:AraC family ethanolamine operon transcriptional activator
MMEAIDIVGGAEKQPNKWQRIGRYRSPPHVRLAIADQISRLAARLHEPDASGISVLALRRAMLMPFLTGLAFDANRSEARIAQPGANLVRKVEDWIEQVPAYNIHALDICIALHVPLRTLQRAFYEEVGIGPMAFLAKKRLAAARSILLRASPDETTVTRIAMNCGFWELGRFAVAYRRMFGESPSDTLARHRDKALYGGDQFAS